jgi:hypothetical protein
MNNLEIIRILQEVQTCINYAGVRADGSINGQDLVDAIKIRCNELQEPIK